MKSQRTLKVWLRRPNGFEYQLSLPAKYAVCHSCHGEGLDSPSGPTPYESIDPEFWRSMLAGDYDRPCAICDGKRVILVPYTEVWPPIALEDYLRQHEHIAKKTEEP